MMVSEETAKRIAKALERLADAAERQQIDYRGSPLQPPLNPGQCYYCGGYHNGLQCPSLRPGVTVAQ